jgi:hypothetical protein
MKPANPPSPAEAPAPISQGHYTWRGILRVAMEHKRELLVGQLIALLAVSAHVPIPC